MQAGESSEAETTQCDMGTQTERGTQTETHPVQKNIDRSYEWNEWELRRRAIQQANRRTNKKCSTTQTIQSHMRRDTDNQAFPPQEVACQSTRNVGTGMARPVVYMAGLRGHKVSQAIKTDLTMDENLSCANK